MDLLKHIILTLAMVQFAFQVNAQKLRMSQVSTSYLAPLAVDQGANVGVGFVFHEWNTTKEGKKGLEKTHHHTLYLQPQLGYITKWRFYSGYLANLEAGWRFGKKGRSVYGGFGVGLGYLNKQEVLTLRTHTNGSTEVVERQARNFFFPSVNYQLGMRLYRNLHLFSKVHYGYQISSTYASQSLVMPELGLHLNLLNKTKADE